MKNKLSKYILIPVAIILWGLILYKIFSGLSGSGDNTINTQYTQIVSNEDFVKDSFELLLNYSDPFLKYIYIPVAVQLESTKEEKKELKRTADARSSRWSKVRSLKWPQIEYGGIVDNENKKVKVCLLKINSNDYLIKAGETIENVNLLEIYNDSIIVEFRDIKKTFVKK